MYGGGHFRGTGWKDTCLLGVADIMIKILIVDDEKPICDLIDLNLSAAGYFCKSVQDGMKAIECIEREKLI